MKSTPVELMQVMLLLVSPRASTAHTLNSYRDPGVKRVTVIVFAGLLSLTPWPTSLYDVSDVADVADGHMNFSESRVESTNMHSPSILGAEKKQEIYR